MEKFVTVNIDVSKEFDLITFYILGFLVSKRKCREKNRKIDSEGYFYTNQQSIYDTWVYQKSHFTGRMKS
jgi:hypothetical protein